MKYGRVTIFRNLVNMIISLFRVDTVTGEEVQVVVPPMNPNDFPAVEAIILKEGFQRSETLPTRYTYERWQR
jgi:hypothetical protein